MMSPPPPSVVPLPFHIRDNALSSSPLPLAASSWYGRIASFAVVVVVVVARQLSPRPPCQDEVHCRRGGVHDRPRRTPPPCRRRCCHRSSRRCMHRWEVVIPAVSIVRAVPVMPPPSLVRADPSHSASLPPLSAVVHHSCTPDAASSAKKKRDAIILFPPRRIERGMKPPPTGCGGTCCLRPLPSSRCNPTTKAAQIWTRTATQRIFGIGTWRRPRNGRGGAAGRAPPPMSMSSERGI